VVRLTGERLLAIIATQNEIASTALDLEAVMRLVVRQTRRLTGAGAAVVELPDGEDMVYCVAAGSSEPLVGLRAPANASLSALCVEHGETLYSTDTRDDERVDRKSCESVGAVSMGCAPLRDGGHVVGVLKIYDLRAEAFDDGDLEVLSLLSGVISAHMALGDQATYSAYGSHHDPLTGLGNLRSFDEHLAAEASRLRRHGDAGALCLLDLDDFQSVNDRIGPAAGDEVLCAVARQLGAIRGEDSAYRIGGDEFVLILVGADEDGARTLAERVKTAVAEDPQCRGVGISWGVATITGDPAWDLARADAALCAAKEMRWS